MQNSDINGDEIQQSIKFILHTIENIASSSYDRERIIQQLRKIRDSILSFHTLEVRNVKKNIATEYPGLPLKSFGENSRTKNIVETMGIPFECDEKFKRCRYLGALGCLNKGDDMKSYAKEKFQCTYNCINGLASATIFSYLIACTTINHGIKYTLINKFLTLNVEIINKSFY